MKLVQALQKIKEAPRKIWVLNSECLNRPGQTMELIQGSEAVILDFELLIQDYINAMGGDKERVNTSLINNLIASIKKRELGLGKSMGLVIDKLDMPTRDKSIIWQCYNQNIPVLIQPTKPTPPELNPEILTDSTIKDFEKLLSIIDTQAVLAIQFNSNNYFLQKAKEIRLEPLIETLDITRNPQADITCQTDIAIPLLLQCLKKKPTTPSKGG